MTGRIQFTCVDCGKEVDREPVSMDIDGLTPKRCCECVMRCMTHDVAANHDVSPNG